MTLDEARRIVADGIERGVKCPCCGQDCKIHARSITDKMAVTAVRMLRLHRERPGEFVHVPSIGDAHGMAALLRYWDLIEEDGRTRPDGGQAGFWRLTPLGVAWASGEARVRHFAWIYDGELICLSSRRNPRSSPRPDISVRDALGQKFDLQVLLHGEREDHHD